MLYIFAYFFWWLVAFLIRLVTPSKNIPTENYDQTTKIVIEKYIFPSSTEEIVIDDQDTMQKLIDFFAAKKSGWRVAWYPIPSGTFSLWFYHDEEIIRIFYVSNVLGITYNAKGMVHLLRPNEHKWLVATLNLDDGASR